MSPKLVIGANGFLGSHVTRQLVADGEDVRVMVRAGANTVSIDDLDGHPIRRRHLRHRHHARGDGRLSMSSTTASSTPAAWLRDPAPLFHTNVEGLRGVLEIAAEMSAAGSLQKFVFTSSYSTVGRKKGRIATEDDVIDRAS